MISVALNPLVAETVERLGGLDFDEALVDLVTAEYHPLAKIAKDVAAGVVLLTAIGAVVVGLIIFLPRLLSLLK